MEKLVIRQGGNKKYHIPSKSHVDKVLSDTIDIPYQIKQKGSNTLSISFKRHIDSETCYTLAQKLGLEVSYLSNCRCILCFPY